MTGIFGATVFVLLLPFGECCSAFCSNGENSTCTRYHCRDCPECTMPPFPAIPPSHPPPRRKPMPPPSPPLPAPPPALPAPAPTPCFAAGRVNITATMGLSAGCSMLRDPAVCERHFLDKGNGDLSSRFAGRCEWNGRAKRCETSKSSCLRLPHLPTSALCSHRRLAFIRVTRAVHGVKA